MEKILASVSLLLYWCAFYWEWFKYTHLNFDASVDELCFTGNKDIVLLSTIFVILYLCVFGIYDVITIYSFIRVFCHKNNLRIFRGSKQQKIKNIEAQKKIKYSYKKE